MDKGIFKKLRASEYWVHKTKKRVLLRFLTILGIFIAYLLFMSAEYGVGRGVMAGLLTWSFFVFCTPIADAGFLLDFPVRLLSGIRMLKSELGVWTIAALLNIYALSNNPAIYETDHLLRLFKQILLNPIPFWLIIGLSAVGTFFSVYFGDELIDVERHEDKRKAKRHGGKHRVVITLFIAVLTILMYYYMVSKLGIF